MNGRVWIGRALVSAAGAVAVLLTAGVSRAGGFDDKDLSLRLPAALSRFSPYGDVAGAGGASAGSKWSSSINPAAVAWTPIPGDLNLSFSPQYARLHFHEDTDIHVAAEAMTWQTPDHGTFQPAFAQARSTRGRRRDGLDFRLDIDVFQLQWGRRVNEDFAFGANFNYARTNTELDLPGHIDFADALGETYGWRFGVLGRICDKLLGGVVFDYAFSPSRTTIFPVFGPGTGARIKDTGHQYLLRPGLSYEYLPDSLVYADYQFGSFHDDTGRLQVHRFMVGVDHQLCDGFYVRSGVTIDGRGNTAWGAGLGIYPCDWFSLDVAYQSHMFPELEPDFGRSNTVVISLSVTF